MYEEQGNIYQNIGTLGENFRVYDNTSHDAVYQTVYHCLLDLHVSQRIIQIGSLESLVITGSIQKFCSGQISESLVIAGSIEVLF